MRHLTGTAALSCLLAAGCTTSPRYEMYRVTGPTTFDRSEIDSYCLQATLIQIEKVAGNKDAAAASSTDISILPVLVDDFTAGAKVPGYAPFKIGMRRNDSFGLRTNVNLTKLPNTCIPSAAGVEVIDKRVEMINTAGAIVKTVLGVAMRADDPLTPEMLPLEINTLEAMTIAAPAGTDRRGALTFQGEHGVKIEFGAAPPDAIERAGLPASRLLNGMVYSACRQALVSFEILHEKTDAKTGAKSSERRRYSKRIAVSDPAYLQFVAFPQKGTVTFHSQCGVSVSSDKETGVSSELAIAEAFANQAKAIKETVDSAKKKEE